MKKSAIIKNDDLLLRPITCEDIEIMRVWRNQNDIRTKFLSQGIISKDQQDKWFSNYQKNDNDMTFMIEEIQLLRRPVGVVSLYDMDSENNVAEFGRLMIGDKEARGRKLGLKSTWVLVNHAFNELNINKIKLDVITENETALNIYIKCGFQLIEEVYLNNIKVYKMVLNKGDLPDYDNVAKEN